MATKQKIPFEFVLEELDRLQPRVRPMFGCYAIYVGEKLVLILRKRDDNHVDDNGVWVAIPREHQESLKKEFPCMRSVRLLGKVETVWQNIPVDDDDFEELVLKACELIRKGDARIGKIPKQRTPKKKK